MYAILWFGGLAIVTALAVWPLPSVLRHPTFSARRTRAGRSGSALSPPIERLGHDLHRLTVDFTRTEHANEPHKAARLRATSIAYDDLLVAAAWALDVPAPARVGHELLDPIDRLTVEAELARAGLSW
jgi:hypothetical protein